MSSAETLTLDTKTNHILLIGADLTPLPRHRAREGSGADQ
jgi:hypothetical protein